MINQALRGELLAMHAEDLRVRAELIASGELGGAYAPRMEAVHIKNAARLRELIAQAGWPCQDAAGQDGADAAFTIAQHAIGEPEFQHEALTLIRAGAAEGRVPAGQSAYLEDRIAMFEGRPQRYGSQWIDDSRDGLTRPWPLADPEHIAELRASVGLEPLRAIPEAGPDLPEERQREKRESYLAWEQWLISKGWRKKPTV